MSRPETPLTEFVSEPAPDPEPEPEPIETRTWEPRNEQDCLNCGGSVTQQFRRVFGDNQDRVWACHGCASAGQIRDGAPAHPDYDTDADRSEYRTLPGSVDGLGGGF